MSALARLAIGHLPAFASMWPDDVKIAWFAAYGKLCEACRNTGETPPAQPGAPWTTRELVELAFMAVDNAQDAGNQTFDSELDFQLSAPEHRGRPCLTTVQIAIVRAIWDNENEQSRRAA